jgi:hypothetical protein
MLNVWSREYEHYCGDYRSPGQLVPGPDHIPVHPAEEAPGNNEQDERHSDHQYRGGGETCRRDREQDEGDAENRGK